MGLVIFLKRLYGLELSTGIYIYRNLELERLKRSRCNKYVRLLQLVMIISQRISFQELDTNGNGKLEFEEFITLFYILLDSKGSLTVLLTELQVH